VQRSTQHGRAGVDHLPAANDHVQLHGLLARPRGVETHAHRPRGSLGRITFAVNVNRRSDVAVAQPIDQRCRGHRRIAQLADLLRLRVRAAGRQTQSNDPPGILGQYCAALFVDEFNLVDR